MQENLDLENLDATNCDRQECLWVRGCALPCENSEKGLSTFGHYYIITFFFSELQLHCLSSEHCMNCSEFHYNDTAVALSENVSMAHHIKRMEIV